MSKYVLQCHGGDHTKERISLDGLKEPSSQNRSDIQLARTSTTCQEQITQEEAWMKLAVLRRLLAGGLLTEARVRKHKRHHDVELCSCNSGEEATVEHVSWRCLHFQDVRQPMIDALEDRVRQLPVITQYAGIVLNSCTLTQDQVILMQSISSKFGRKTYKNIMQKISKMIHLIIQINLRTDVSYVTQTVTPSFSKKAEVCFAKNVVSMFKTWVISV